MVDLLQAQFGFTDPREESGRASPFWGTLEVGAHDALQMLSAFGWGVANRVGNERMRDRFGEAYQAEQGYGEEAISELPTSRQQQLAAPIGVDNFSLATLGAQFLRNIPSMAAGVGATLVGGVPGAVAAGSVLTGGDAMSSMVDYFSTATDNDIAVNPAFQSLRDQGMDPTQVRQAAIDTTVGNADLWATLAGGALGRFTPETLITRLFQGKGLKLGIGAVPGVALGTVGGAAGGAAEEAIPAIVQNEASAETAGAIPETSVAESAIAGAILEAPGGAVAGTTLGGKKNSQVTTVPAGQTSPAVAAALATSGATPGAAQAVPTATVPPAAAATPGVTTPTTGTVQPTPPAQASPGNAVQSIQGTVPGSNTVTPPAPVPTPTPAPGPAPAPTVVTPPAPIKLDPAIEQALTGAPAGTEVEATPIEDADQAPGNQAIPEQALPDSKIAAPGTVVAPTQEVEATPILETPLTEVAPEATPEVTTSMVEGAPLEPTKNVVQGPENVVQAPVATPVAPEAQVAPTGLPEAPAAISTETAEATPEVLPEVEAPPVQPTMQEAFAPSLEGGPVDTGMVEPTLIEDAPALETFTTEPKVLKVAPTEEVRAETKKYNKKQQNKTAEQTRQEQKATANAPADRIMARKDLTNEEKQKAAVTDPSTARKILEDTGSTTADDYADPSALVVRLATTLQAAQDAGISWITKGKGGKVTTKPLPDRITASVPDEMVWLKNMELALNRLKRNINDANAINRLRAGEHAARQGDYSVFRSDHGAVSSGRSGGVGGQAAAQQDQAQLQRYIEEQAEERAADQAGEVVPEGTEEEQEAVAAAAERAEIASGEEVVPVTEEYDEVAGGLDIAEEEQETEYSSETAVEEEGTQAPKGPTERPAIVEEVKEGEHYTVPQNRGVAVVQTIRKGQRQKMEGVAPRPAGKVTLKPREPRQAEVTKEVQTVEQNVEAVSRETTPEVTTETRKSPGTLFSPPSQPKVPKPADVQAASDAVRHTNGAVEFSDGNWVVPIEETTARDAIARKIGDKGRGALNTIVNHILGVANRAMPNIKIYIVADEDINTSAGIYGESEPQAAGYYEPAESGRDHYIVIGASAWANNTGWGKRVLAHELIHAITVDTLIASDKLANTFQSFLDQIREHAAFLGHDPNDIYGLNNIYEFFAELTNPSFVGILQNTTVSRDVANAFGLEGWRKATAWNAIVAFVRKIFGGKNNEFTAYELLMSSFERMSHTYDRASGIKYNRQVAASGADQDVYFRSAEREFAQARAQTRTHIGTQGRPIPAKAINRYFAPANPQAAAAANANISSSMFVAAAQGAVQRGSNLGGSINRWLLGAQGSDHIMRAHESKFDPGQLRAGVDGLAHRYTEFEKLMAADSTLLVEEANALDKHKETKINKVSAQEVYVDLIEDMDNYKVDPRLPLNQHTWLGKNAVKGIVPKKHYPRILKEYNDLKAKAPELAAFLGKKFDYYSAKAKESIDAVLSEDVVISAKNHGNTPTRVAALAAGHRIASGKGTTQDEILVGKTAFKRIAKTPEYKLQQGPYHPAMRWGDWIASAKVNVADPTFGKWQKPTAPNTAKPMGYTVDFSGTTAETDASRFATQLASGKAREEYHEVKKVYTDKNGNEYVPDPKAPGGLHKLTAKDVQQGAEERWRVWIQDEYTDFRENQSEAQSLTEELKKDPYFKTVNEVRMKRGEPPASVALAGSHQLEAIKESLAKRMGGSSNQGILGVVNLVLSEAAHRAAPGMSISKHRMPKRHVAGQSRDTLRVMHAYSTQMNSYIAAVRTAQEIDDAFTALRENVAKDYSKNQPIKQAVVDELEMRRANMQGMHERGGAFAPAINVATSLQVTDKLMSPGYSIANLTQWPMVGLAVLSEKHGVYRASRAMTKAARDIGFLQNLKLGGKDTWNAITTRLDKATNFHDFITSGPKITPAVKTMLDSLRDVGTLDPDAGFEALNVVITGKATKVLHKVETIFRQFPRAVEASMRYSMAIAAYDLAIAKNMSVEAATQHARDVVERSMFNYNPANSARFFSHPVGRMGFQFMKFAFNMYQLMGSQLVRVFKQGNTKQDRIEAARGFAMLMGAHFLVAGATGLPTEPIRVPLFILNSMGLIDFTMDDLETEFRELMTDVTGSETFAEVLARGFPRLAGIDFSNRLGLSSLVFQRPLGEIDEEKDFMAYAFKYFGGPTAQSVSDLLAAVRYGADGDFVRAIEKGIPIKILSDAANAYRGGTEGLKTKYGDVYHTYSIMDATLETLGIGTAGAANTAEARTYYYSQQTQQQEERRDILQDYRDNPGKRAQFYRTFQEFNKKWSPSNPLNVKAAQDFIKEHTGNYKKGIKEEPSNRGLLRRIEGFIN